MAKDNYDVVVYKVLLYLYACLKRKAVFDEATFRKTVGGDAVNDDYLDDVLHMMSQEGLIKGMAFTKAWGSTYMAISDPSDMKITVKGIQYLQDNDKMKKVENFLLESCDIVASLIQIVRP